MFFFTYDKYCIFYDINVLLRGETSYFSVKMGRTLKLLSDGSIILPVHVRKVGSVYIQVVPSRIFCRKSRLLTNTPYYTII